MTTKIRIWIAGVTVVALFSLVFVSGPTYGGDENTELKGAAVKIAALIKKGDDDGAKKLAKTSVKKTEDVGSVMHLFKPRKPRTKEGIPGLGWGPKELKGALAPKDGIELMVRELAKDVPAGYDPEVGRDAAYAIAAIADMAKAKGFDKYDAKKNKKDWDKFNDEMREAAIDLAKANGKKNADIRIAAGKLNSVCINCHFQFKP